MTGRSRLWFALAAAFTAVNLIGFGMAIQAAETMHGGVHVVLSVAGAAAMWWAARRRADVEESALPLGGTRLDQLQQSVDAIALEVERIGESQRFQAKLQTERGDQVR